MLINLSSTGPSFFSTTRTKRSSRRKVKNITEAIQFTGQFFFFFLGRGEWFLIPCHGVNADLFLLLNDYALTADSLLQ
jgi:hypothetical protein